LGKYQKTLHQDLNSDVKNKMVKKLKCWKQSKTDRNWWFIPKEKPTPTSPTERTLNIVKLSDGKYHTFKAEGLKSPTRLKKSSNLPSARKFAKSYMKKHDVCKI